MRKVLVGMLVAVCVCLLTTQAEAQLFRRNSCSSGQCGYNPSVSEAEARALTLGQFGQVAPLVVEVPTQRSASATAIAKTYHTAPIAVAPLAIVPLAPVAPAVASAEASSQPATVYAVPVPVVVQQPQNRQRRPRREVTVSKAKTVTYTGVRPLLNGW